MNTFAGTIARCFFTCLLLSSASAFADRPAMSDHEGIPLPPPAAISESTGSADGFRPEASATEPMAEPEAMAAPEAASEAPYVPLVEQTTGDAVQVQAGETLGVRLLDFPRRGMSMDKVKNELGEPINISATVGEPPITSWVYDDRTVYFEYSSVIHVVATR